MSERKPLLPDVLVVGTTIRLVALETTRAKWSTMLIGARPGRYLVVEMPHVNGVHMKLDDGTHWSANFISRGAVYSFNTEVLGATFRPAPILTLSYPEDVEVAMLRMVKRYPVNIPVVSKVVHWPKPSAEHPEDGEPHEPPLHHAPPPLKPEASVKALVVDISEGGFLMACPQALAADAIMENNFYLPREEPVSGVQAVVRTCRGKPGGYFIGLAYIPSNSPPEPLARLNELITSIENMPLRL
ncbi:MAG: flagellar brake protein [Candidatus Adiutrix sp.]|nr:flagellar brake protein [Candidatus Adiutrix sp.]